MPSKRRKKRTSPKGEGEDYSYVCVMCGRLVRGNTSGEDAAEKASDQTCTPVGEYLARNIASAPELPSEPPPKSTGP